MSGTLKYTSRNIKEKYYNGRAIYLDYWRQFTAFRSILEKCLSEEMCLELKAALKYVLKNVREAFLPIPKNISKLI